MENNLKWVEVKCGKKAIFKSKIARLLVLPNQKNLDALNEVLIGAPEV